MAGLRCLSLLLLLLLLPNSSANCVVPYFIFIFIIMWCRWCKRALQDPGWSSLHRVFESTGPGTWSDAVSDLFTNATYGGTGGQVGVPDVQDGADVWWVVHPLTGVPSDVKVGSLGSQLMSLEHERINITGGDMTGWVPDAPMSKITSMLGLSKMWSWSHLSQHGDGGSVDLVAPSMRILPVPSLGCYCWQLPVKSYHPEPSPRVLLHHCYAVSAPSSHSVTWVACSGSRSGLSSHAPRRSHLHALLPCLAQTTAASG